MAWCPNDQGYIHLSIMEYFHRVIVLRGVFGFWTRYFYDFFGNIFLEQMRLFVTYKENNMYSHWNIANFHKFCKILKTPYLCFLTVENLETMGWGRLGQEPGGGLGREPGGSLGREPGGRLGREPGGRLGRESGGRLGREPGGRVGWEPVGRLGWEPGGLGRDGRPLSF